MTHICVSRSSVSWRPNISWGAVLLLFIAPYTSTRTFAFQIASIRSSSNAPPSRRSFFVGSSCTTVAGMVKGVNEGSSFAVNPEELVKGLPESERTVINVFRKCGPSVAFVTSVMNENEDTSRNRRRRSSRRASLRNETQKDSTVAPRGRSLGSGSGFLVSSNGYLVTNYHVIERAHRMNTAVLNYNENIKDLVTNTTKFFLGSDAGNSKTANEFINQLRNQTVERLSVQSSSPNGKPRASVYVRINSSKQFQECRIVDVKPELDMAVLRIVSEPETPYPFLKYGSSSDLLVGQTLIAIGNPFGLDQTVTSGVVSATNRPMMGTAGNRIPNCIQTDAAINPGNSGGPLLNSAGELIGINTAILSTSGSNAGIGFAVPSDPVQEAVDIMIQKDRVQTYKRPSPGYLGISVAGDSLAKSLQLKLKFGSKSVENEGLGLFVTGVADDSPAANLGMTQLEITKEEGRVILGDRIVAVGSKIVSTRSDLEEDMKARVEGEQISLTLEDPKGGRRVVYLTLGAKKL
eukprot:scaffold59105_cov43-Attheya_sp.AAC.2